MLSASWLLVLLKRDYVHLTSRDLWPDENFKSGLTMSMCSKIGNKSWGGHSIGLYKESVQKKWQ